MPQRIPGFVRSREEHGGKPICTIGPKSCIESMQKYLSNPAKSINGEAGRNPCQTLTPMLLADNAQFMCKLPVQLRGKIAVSEFRVLRHVLENIRISAKQKIEIYLDGLKIEYLAVSHA